MTDCPVCSEKLRLSASECPQCGCPAPLATRGRFVLVRLLLVGALAALVLPGWKRAASGDPVRQVRQQLTRIGAAIQQYHADHGAYPPAFVADVNGQPMHSWRVLLLPYLGERRLYEDYDLHEPWDGPHNRLLVSRKPAVYALPGEAPGSPDTAFAAVVGPLCFFRGREFSRQEDIESLSETAVAGETLASIPWTKPEDIPYQYSRLGTPGFFGSRLLRSGAHFLAADGSVHLLPGDIELPRLRFWFTRSAERIDEERVSP